MLKVTLGDYNLFLSITEVLQSVFFCCILQSISTSPDNNQKEKFVSLEVIQLLKLRHPVSFQVL